MDRFGTCRSSGTSRSSAARSAAIYATWLAERYGARAVVINPAIRPAEDLRRLLGRQRNPHTGVEYDVTPAHFAELAALEVARITRPERYFLLVRTGDELLDWRVASAFYAGAFQYVAGGGDHGWEDFGDEVASVLRFCGCACRRADQNLALAR